MLWASQVAPGNENGLQLRVYGEKAGLSWRQDNPNQMWFTELGKPATLLTRGGAISQPPAASMNVRIPGGHPEGYLEAFATLYSQFAEVIRGSGKEFVAAAAIARRRRRRRRVHHRRDQVEQERRQVDQVQRSVNQSFR